MISKLLGRWRGASGTHASLFIPREARDAITVNDASAMSLSSAYAAVQLLSNAVAGSPLKVYRPTPSGKEVARQHPAHKLLHDDPNPHETAFEYWHATMHALLLTGNSYSHIVRDGNGNARELWRLDPRAMTVERDGRDLIYKYAADGGVVDLSQADVLHLRGPGVSPTGDDPLKVTRAVFSAALAAENYAADYFQNAITPSGLFEHPRVIDDEAYEAFKNMWRQFTRPGRRHELLVLEAGTSYKPLESNPEKGQLLETRGFHVNEIARIFGVPVHLLGQLSGQPRANLESLSLEFARYGVVPWLTRIAQRCTRSLLPDGYSCEHTVDAMLRPATLDRYRAHALALNAGWMSRNEVRAIENLPRRDGFDDIIITPGASLESSMVDAGSVDDE